MTVTGVKYWRKKRRLTKTELAALSGVSGTFISVADKAIHPTTMLWCYIRLARALNVTVDDLCREYREEQLTESDRVASKKTSEREPVNCIDRYRKERNLSFAQLGSLLGVSRQRAHVICRSKHPSENCISLLAGREGVSAKRFLEDYKGCLYEAEDEV